MVAPVFDNTAVVIADAKAMAREAIGRQINLCVNDVPVKGMIVACEFVGFDPIGEILFKVQVTAALVCRVAVTNRLPLA